MFTDKETEAQRLLQFTFFPLTWLLQFTFSGRFPLIEKLCSFKLVSIFLKIAALGTVLPFYKWGELRSVGWWGFAHCVQGWDSGLLSLLSGDWDKDECVCVMGGEAGWTPPPVTPVPPGAAGASPQREVPGPFLHVNRL